MPHRSGRETDCFSLFRMLRFSYSCVLHHIRHVLEELSMRCSIAVIGLVLASPAVGLGQLNVDSSSGSVTSSLLFRGGVNYTDFAGTFPAHVVGVTQTSLNPGTVNLSYPVNTTFDFFIAAYGSGFRTIVRYTNNTGEAIIGLRIGYSGSSGASSGFITDNALFPSRGTLTNPTGPTPVYTNTSSMSAPNGGGVSGNSSLLTFQFATPLAIGDTTSFSVPIGILQPGPQTVVFTFTPVPEPTVLLTVAVAGIAVCGRRTFRQKSVVLRSLRVDLGRWQ